jgi:hypothetical protein
VASVSSGMCCLTCDKFTGQIRVLVSSSSIKGHVMEDEERTTSRWRQNEHNLQLYN